MSPVYEYFERIHIPELQEAALALHDYIVSLDPKISCAIKWNCPTYNYKKYMCYMNVSLKRKRIELGFAQGKYLLDPLGRFDNREKLVAHVYLTQVEQLDDERLHALMLEAIDYQEQHC